MKNKVIVTFLYLTVLYSLIYGQLKNLANPKNFEIGPCIDMNPLKNEAQYRNTIIAEFNRAVAENAFKMYVWTGPYSYNWNDTDYLLNFCRQNNIKLRGHCLVWYAVVPSWLQNGNYSSQQVRDMLEAYIKAMVGRYKDYIDEWDVVNEAVSDSPPYSFRSNDFWYQKLGADYIRLAFQWAHEADPDCKLFYNDYGAEGTGGKADGVYNLVSQLKQQGVPIHGVGWQSHWWHSWRLGQANYENLARLKALGLEVKITELDLPIPENQTATPEMLRVQALAYGDVAYFCLSNKIGMVMWGFTDKHTWLGSNRVPLIFDTNYNKKPAYYAIESVLKAKVDGAIYNSDIENGPYCWLTNGTCSVSTTTAQKHSGNYSLLVSNRANAWAGPAQYVNNYLWENGQGNYNVGAWVYSSTADQFKITIFIMDGSSQNRYVSIPAVSVPANQWTEVKGTINVTWSGTLRVARLYIETTNSTGNFYVDDVYMVTTSTSGGGGGGGGGQTPTIVNVMQDVYLIDDCDDGDTTNNFGGHWYNYADNGSTVTPRPFEVTFGGMNPEGYCGYYSWRLGNVNQYPYAGMGTNLSDDGVVDLRNYDGISFWYKSTRPHIFMVRMPTDGDQNGWASYQVTISSSANWTKRTVLFNELSLPSWSPNTPEQYPLRLDNINTITFQSSDGQLAVGELYVDDIYLVKRVTSTADKVYRITVNINPQNSGSVYIKPHQLEYIAGSTVTLLAIANSGWRFSNWSGAIQSSNRQVDVVVSTNLVITANFTQFTDTTPPQLAITSPNNNATVSGIVNIQVNVTDDVGVSKVLFYIDNVCVSTDTTSPYSYSWDTRLVSNGTHTIRVVAYDTSNNQGQTQITVNVNNQVSTTYTLTVNINPQGAGSVSLNPSGGVYVAGTTVTLTAQANSGWRFSSWSGAISSTQNPVSVVMSTNRVITANFVDIQGPQVSISTPSNNAVVSGVVNIVANVTDNVGVSRVLFYIDNVCVSTDTTSPYSYSWDTRLVSNGTHTIRVVAYDTSNNQGQTQITVNVNNPTTNIYTLTVNISPSGAGSVSLNPSGGVYVAGTTVTVLAQANAGWVFSGWSGDLSGSQNPASIVMNSSKTVVANFELVSSTVVDSKPRIDSINLVSGSVISGLYRLVVSCSDDVGIGKVELYIDGILVATLTVSPYEYVIDSRGLVNGRHEMMVVVYDSVGQIDSEVIEFIVDNVEVVEKLRGRYLLSVSGDGVNDEIDLGDDVEWVKLYDVKGKIVYEAKNKIGLDTKLGVGVYIYKAKLKTGGIKVGSITVVK